MSGSWNHVVSCPLEVSLSGFFSLFLSEPEVKTSQKNWTTLTSFSFVEISELEVKGLKFFSFFSRILSGASNLSFFFYLWRAASVKVWHLRKTSLDARERR